MQAPLDFPGESSYNDKNEVSCSSSADAWEVELPSVRLLGGWLCLTAAVVAGCGSPQTASAPLPFFTPSSELRQAAKKILDSEEFPKPSSQEKATIEREIALLRDAPRFESEVAGSAGTASRYRIACCVLANFGRKAVPMLLEALDDDRPIGSLYFALAIEKINPRIARGVWAALEKDGRTIPCMRGRRFYSISVGEAAKGRGELPAPPQEEK